MFDWCVVDVVSVCGVPLAEASEIENLGALTRYVARLVAKRNCCPTNGTRGRSLTQVRAPANTRQPIKMHIAPPTATRRGLRGAPPKRPILFSASVIQSRKTITTRPMQMTTMPMLKPSHWTCTRQPYNRSTGNACARSHLDSAFHVVRCHDCTARTAHRWSLMRRVRVIA